MTQGSAATRWSIGFVKVPAAAEDVPEALEEAKEETVVATFVAAGPDDCTVE